MSSEHSPNGSTSHEKESLINGHSHQETESPVRESFKTDTGMDKYSLSSKYSSSFTPEENHNGIVINGRGGGEHEELDRLQELESSTEIFLKPNLTVQKSVENSKLH